MTSQHHQDDLRIAERAAEWLSILADGDPKDQEEFAAWLGESARHVEEFLFVSATLQEYRNFDPQRRIDVDALIAQAASNVVALQDTSHPRSLQEGGREQATESRIEWASKAEDRRLGLLFFLKRAGMENARSRRAATAIAAILAGLAVSLGWLLFSDNSQSFATAVGEIRSFELEDGSTLLLNTQSRVEVRFSETAREVRLVSGEVMFKVARNPLRPFRVYSDNAVIQAIGTQFNVYRRDEGTRVSVIEGAVQISKQATAKEKTAGEKSAVHKQSPKLQAGEEAEIAPNGRVKRITAMDPVRTVAWQQRRLVFLNEPLASVAEEFNRYNRTPRIQVEGNAVAGNEITGVFDADDPESFIEFLKRDGSLTFEMAAGQIVIRTH